MSLFGFLGSALSGAGDAVGSAWNGAAGGGIGRGLGGFLSDYFNRLVPPVPTQQQYQGALSGLVGNFDPGQVQITDPAVSERQLVARQASGAYNPTAGYSGGLVTPDHAAAIANLFSGFTPSKGTAILQNIGMDTANSDIQLQQRRQMANTALANAGGAPGANAGMPDPKAIALQQALLTGDFSKYIDATKPIDTRATNTIYDPVKGTGVFTAPSSPDYGDPVQVQGGGAARFDRHSSNILPVPLNMQPAPKLEFPNGQGVNPYTAAKVGDQIPTQDNSQVQIYDPSSPTGTKFVPRAQAQGQPGPMTANSPAPAISDASREANAARVAAGEPLTQIFPGYRGNVMAQRDQARNDAIAKIIAENPGMSAADAGTELANRTISFQSGKKSSGQLTTMLGATKQAVGQLDFNISKAKEEMAKLPSTDLSPILNAIARGEERWTGNPAYSSLFYYMHATAVESARILSGGQASTAQLHQGAMDEAQKWSGINMTPASFDAVAEAMRGEGQSRLQTYESALRSQRVGAPARGALADPLGIRR